MTQWFGEDPEKYDYLDPPGHPGLDFDLRLETPVVAAVGGVVEHAGFHPRWPGRGIYVVVQHTDMDTYYMHLYAPSVRVGHKVEAGDLIGLSGNTAAPGWSTGPHLHFGVYRDGTFVDPAPLFGLTRP